METEGVAENRITGVAVAGGPFDLDGRPGVGGVRPDRVATMLAPFRRVLTVVEGARRRHRLDPGRPLPERFGESLDGRADVFRHGRFERDPYRE